MFEDLGIVDRVLANGWLAMPMDVTAPDGRVTRSPDGHIGLISDVGDARAVTDYFAAIG